MSFSSLTINAPNYSVVPLLQSSCISLRVPVNQEKIPPMTLVYLSSENSKEGNYVVKPISLENIESLQDEQAIKSEKRLAIIQEFADGVIISVHSRYKQEGLNLFVKNANEKPKFLCRLGFVMPLNDENITAINSVYEYYLSDIEKKLTSLSKEKNQSAPPIVSKEDKCTIC